MDNQNKKKIKKLKKWEKIFIIVNIGVILIICGIYSHRLIYYYEKEHPKIKDTTLITELKKNLYSNKGLYEDSNNKGKYYYKGKDVSNYVYYSNRLFRIISLDSTGIKMITDNNQSILSWGNGSDYEKSYIYQWLNKTDNNNSGIFIDSLSNYERILVKSEFCIDNIEDINKITCDKVKEDYIGLISIEEYLKSGGADSFLNNNSYYWTINGSKDNKVWYIFSEGGINNDSLQNDTYLNYGVRPVIKINSNVSFKKGNGTIDSPYIIDDTSSNNVGAYVKYSDNIWKIQNKTDNYYKLIFDGTIKDNESDYKLSYNEINNYYNKYYNNLDKSLLVKCDFYNGNYSSSDYRNVYKNKETKFIGSSSVGELFIGEYENTWLSNKYNDNLSYVTTENSLLADNIYNKNSIRPVICINSNVKISSGDGTKDSPYIMEVQDETNN